ncbi:hypothetical protein B0H11DRAFT_507357 [Mycena galericulata]|nr:hypothetical protein B0H11DRAFT_507357 [Mycena galericulata]
MRTSSSAWQQESQGIPLYQAPGPRDLLRGIVEALNGYLNLLRKGLIHRDVSPQTVLLVPNARESPRQDLPPLEIKATGFRSILIDSGWAVKWREERQAASHRSGTLPFLSRNLLKSWSMADDQSMHTALDDLESFIWILVWVVFRIGKTLNQLSPLEKDDMTLLDSDDIKILWRIKNSFILECTQNKAKDSPFLRPFLPIFLQWIAFTDKAREHIEELILRKNQCKEGDEGEMKEVYDEIEALALKTGCEFVEAGLSGLANLAEAWAPKLSTTV